jgi:WD40 repeat protein
MLVLKVKGSRGVIWALAFTPDGRRLASAGTDGDLRLWDLETTAAHTLGQHFNPGSLSIDSDGRALACGWGRGVTLWDLHTGNPRELTTFAPNARVAYSPDGQHLAVAGRQSLVLWDTRTASPSPLSVNWQEDVGNLTFSPDGTTLAADFWVQHYRGRWEHWIRLTDLATGREQGALRGYGNCANDLAFSPDGAALAAACTQFLWVWDVASGEPITRVKVNRLHYQALGFTPDGRFLFAARNDGTMRVLETERWRERAAFDWGIGPLVSLDVAPDGMRAACGSKRGKIVVWDVDL